MEAINQNQISEENVKTEMSNNQQEKESDSNFKNSDIIKDNLLKDNENSNDNNEINSSSTRLESNKKTLSFLHPNSENSVLKEAQKTYIHIDNNEFVGNATGYVTEIGHYMPCMCKYDPDTDDPGMACGEESGCINRAVLIECANDCPCGKYCQNKRFQRKEYAQVEVFKTEKKGYGLRTLTPLKPGHFVMEYSGEIITYNDFKKRTQEYSQEGLKHFYFMSLKKDEMIDATRKGNLARFMNHSCNPNCELQKWVVGSRLRMGIFTLRNIEKNEELTFDYQFERYGDNAQPCYCGEPTCTGFIGGNKKSELKEIISEEPERIEVKPKKSHRGRKSAYDNDYIDPFNDDMLEDGKSKGVDYLDDVPDFVKSMFHASKAKHIKKLLRRLEMTTSNQSLKTFMRFHGLLVLKIWIRTYKSDPSLCEDILEILKKLPYSNKNLINDQKLEDVIKPLCDSPEKNVAALSKELIDMWSQLPTVYKIPKLKPSQIKEKQESEQNKESNDEDLTNSNGKRINNNDNTDDDNNKKQKLHENGFNNNSVNNNNNISNSRYGNNNISTSDMDKKISNNSLNSTSYRNYNKGHSFQNQKYLNNNFNMKNSYSSNKNSTYNNYRNNNMYNNINYNHDINNENNNNNNNEMNGNTNSFDSNSNYNANNISMNHNNYNNDFNNSKKLFNNSFRNAMNFNSNNNYTQTTICII